jgi:hypothetical protein
VQLHTTSCNIPVRRTGTWVLKGSGAPVYPGYGVGRGCGLGVGTRPLPVTTPGAPVIGMLMKPGVGVRPGPGVGMGHDCTSQHVGSLGSGTSMHPGVTVGNRAHLIGHTHSTAVLV